jgi:uncharacterized protein (TIGR02246 family)
MKTGFTAFCMLLFSVAFAQTATDETEVRKLVDELITSFNSHDFTTLKLNSTDDVSWVNMMGRWWKGRDEVVSAHDEIFGKIFKGVKFENKSVTLKPITPDVMVVHVVEQVGAFYPPDGVDRGVNKRPASENNLQLIYVKKGGKWLLSAAHNTEVYPAQRPDR